MDRLTDVRVRSVVRLVSPTGLRRELPATAAAEETVARGRRAIEAILRGDDDRLLAIVGPCSIHDPVAALDYAGRLARVGRGVAARALVVMRVYFEKPRTTIGWKGLINDPHLDGSEDVETGLRRARELLLRIAELGLPAGTEFLDPIVPQYIADLVSWAAVGARTTESQTHREMASGLSMPVGFKNGTDGSLQTALDALVAARSPHSFLGIDPDGVTSVVRTSGNPLGHLVLRGGRARSNFDPDSIADALARLAAAGLPPVVMVDCSHANSGKVPARQEDVWRSVLEQRRAGTRGLIGVMLESHLEEGNQPFPKPASELRYGVSITDACLGWEATERLLRVV
ncbi:MAG TPA: 3-deoxy-7-phosphoheptulonate synthase [Candidatus Binatia bacterium]|nr:3-deoxy-7-phosphoheptulonate synthase [Candidatus Binatia bacterium]